MDITLLLTEAKSVLEKAYAPYSRFKVGSAIATPEGKVFTGCNIENASLGLTICAERVALYKGLSEGERIFSDLAVVSEQNPPITPCGACRQVLMEFCPTLRIILADLKGNYRIVTLKELMPEPFFHWKV